MPVNYTVYYKYLEKKIEKPFYVFTLHHELIWEFFQNIGSVFLRLLKSILITSLIIDLYLGIRHIQYLIIHTVHACNFPAVFIIRLQLTRKHLKLLSLTFSYIHAWYGQELARNCETECQPSLDMSWC